MAGMNARNSVVLLMEWALVIGLIGLFVFAGFLPAWQTLNTDFPNYYIAASLRARGIPLGRAYEWIWFQREKDHLGIDQPLVGFMPNPPFCALPVLPLTPLQPLAAKRVWLILNLGFLVLSLGILRRHTNLPWRRLLLIAFLCILPLRSNFLCGQYYVFLLLLLCVAYHLARTGRPFMSGIVVAVAAALKLFPALFLLLFLRKRNWRSAAGLITGTLTLTAISIALFGWDVHRVWMFEVLPRALRGDIIDPYALGWSSFSALWHRFFLFEPQLNPGPFLNSPLIYSPAQALTATLLLFSFLVMANDDRDRAGSPMEWAAFLPLLLLLSSMPSPYHYCILILATIVAFDSLLRIGKSQSAMILLLLFALACAPVPYAMFGGKLLLTRLFATLIFYLSLLPSVVGQRPLRLRPAVVAAAAILCTLLSFSGYKSTRGRSEDFSRRLAIDSPGYSASNPVRVGDQLLFTEMLDAGYGAMILHAEGAQQLPSSGDVLSISGDQLSSVAYVEETNLTSSIVRFPLVSPGPNAEPVADGEDPAVSNDGKWLLFTRRAGGATTIWLSAINTSAPPRLVARTNQNIMDVVFGAGNELLAAAGPVSDSHLITLNLEDGTIQPMSAIAGPVRYPSLSPDGQHLAFSRRVFGSWQLLVRDLHGVAEYQLTDAPCNATVPSWENNDTLLYATDCGRGLGLTALARVSLKPLK